MKRILICYIITFFSSILLLGQSKQLDLKLIDIYTHQPISDAHIFVGNTTIGSVTDQEGQTSIIIPIGITEDLIISQIRNGTIEKLLLQIRAELECRTNYIRTFCFLSKSIL